MGNTWYTVAYGPVTIVHVSTERSMATTDAQYKWLAQTLRSIDRTVTPWVVVHGHRPIYADEAVSCDPFTGCGDVDAFHYYWNLLDPLFTEARVDAVFAGHHHVTQRQCAAYQGRCVMNSTWDAAAGANVYDGPLNPVYYVVGNAGATSDTPGVRSPGTGAAFNAWESPNTAYSRIYAAAGTLTVEIVDARSHTVPIHTYTRTHAHTHTHARAQHTQPACGGPRSAGCRGAGCRGAKSAQISCLRRESESLARQARERISCASGERPYVPVNSDRGLGQVLDTSLIRKAPAFAITDSVGAPAASNAVLLSIDGLHEFDLE